MASIDRIQINTDQECTSLGVAAYLYFRILTES
jgi:hypothetical protein